MLLLPAVKVFWRYFGEAQMDFQSIDRDLFIEAAAGSIVLVVCLPLSTFKRTEARCVPLTVLEIPFNPAAGPMEFFGPGNSIVVQETESTRCSCVDSTGNESGESLAYPEFCVCDQDCLMHGEQAVNTLEQLEFKEISDDAWVYAGNTRQELPPQDTR